PYLPTLAIPSPPLPFLLNDSASPALYTLSLHDALPISLRPPRSLAMSTPTPAPPADDQRRGQLRGVVDGVRRTELTTSQKLMVLDRKSTRLNSSHVSISYAVFCLKKKKKIP